MIESHQPELQLNLTYVQRPVRVLDHKEKVLRTKSIRYVKVLWNDQMGEAIWESEDELRKKHPEFFD